MSAAPNPSGSTMYDRIFQFNKSRPSKIVIRSGLESSLDDYLVSEERDGLFLVHDPAVQSIADRLAKTLPITAAIPFSGGEPAKRMTAIIAMTEQMLEAGATRHSMILGLGGGVTTDVAAFLAAIYMRGVPCALLPTSLLAMVDASLGGKNGVDLGVHKNVMGTIHQPDFVLCDPDWLDTLPEDEFRTGLAEVVKKAAMLDEHRFEWLEQNADAINQRDKKICEEMIVFSAALKMGVVIDDEGEAWRRMLLNFGHTVGHAYEGLSKFEISHGQAVAMGMLVECEAAQSNAGDRIRDLLRTFGLPTERPSKFKVDDVWELMRSDKKVRAGEIHIAVPKTLGRGRVQTLTKKEFLAAHE